MRDSPPRDEASAQTLEGSSASTRARADAIASRERILDAAAVLFADRRASMTQVAASASVGRSTLYRHFPGREALAAALAERRAQVADDEPEPRPKGRAGRLAQRPPRRLGRLAALPLEVTHVLDEVPPHLIADQLVAEARRAAGSAVALYVVDIDGSALVRLAGSDDFPARLHAPPALGPEIVPEGLASFEARLARELPRCTVAPLWLRGRVLGLLLCVGTPLMPLDDIAKQGAAALELADGYTDLIEAARRRKPTTAAAEVQHHLLPPRIARVTGAQIAGGLLPTYEVGGDWFDLVENLDGAWLAIAEAPGSGPTAAGFSAAVLGALRAARRIGRDLVGAVRTMDEVVRQLGNPAFEVTAVVARWHAPSSTLESIRCGRLAAWVVAADGRISELEAPEHPPLGSGSAAPPFEASRRRMDRGERLVLTTDGVTGRAAAGGRTLGTKGLRDAIAAADAPTAAGTAMAIQRAVATSSDEPMEADATFVVLAVD
ncbi:SpoIIE family protein phosphatase [Conexibacter arvalis]|uniref:AcrR family transcriptional regulator n=1 Tax=Conexibacter arvalis TaxID=912552 RepID=A0A840IHU1_9ACTN|nr:SpoIIE family protein phosphatase [Conexibacter arvalis]MBB4664532.1 AcrR family transcriptional regulator [Conexibacter arvalis]